MGIVGRRSNKHGPGSHFGSGVKCRRTGGSRGGHVTVIPLGAWANNWGRNRACLLLHL